MKVIHQVAVAVVARKMAPKMSRWISGKDGRKNHSETGSAPTAEGNFKVDGSFSSTFECTRAKSRFYATNVTANSVTKVISRCTWEYTQMKGHSPATCARFSHSSNLTAHMRVHSPSKPFSCNQCSKKFSQSAHLTSHLKTHCRDEAWSLDTQITQEWMLNRFLSLTNRLGASSPATVQGTKW